MAEEKPAFLEEEGLAEEEAGETLELEGEEEVAEGEGEEEVLGEEEAAMDFASPTEALAAALEEHGADAAALMEWFEQYGYELVEAGGGMEGAGGPVEFDLISMRNKAAAGAFPGEMA